MEENKDIDKEEPSLMLLEEINKMVSEKFHLDKNYQVSNFSFSGSNAKITLSSAYFDISVKVKGSVLNDIMDKLELDKDMLG
mgnify:CR=1 FL=1